MILNSNNNKLNNFYNYIIYNRIYWNSWWTRSISKKYGYNEGLIKIRGNNSYNDINA